MDSTLQPLALGLGVSAGLMVLVWLLSLARRDASIIDVFWGLGFALVAWAYFLSTEAESLRKTFTVLLVTAWGVRLSVHILLRNWGRGEDYRYQEMRAKHGGRFWWISLFTVFLLQAALLWVISAPLFQAQRSVVPGGLSWLDAVGLVLFNVGFFFEAVADWQLTRFKAAPANKGKLLTSGLWRYTRHPNYFGDALVWWGFFFLALATPGSLWTVVSPVLMTFMLLRVSGVALLEQRLKTSKPEYREYIEATNAFVPWFPRKRPG
jgi:steroid 5-alpha reductase family enzyme